jgi:hypothetical protein
MVTFGSEQPKWKQLQKLAEEENKSWRPLKLEVLYLRSTKKDIFVTKDNKCFFKLTLSILTTETKLCYVSWSYSQKKHLSKIKLQDNFLSGDVWQFLLRPNDLWCQLIQWTTSIIPLSVAAARSWEIGLTEVKQITLFPKHVGWFDHNMLLKIKCMGICWFIDIGVKIIKMEWLNTLPYISMNVGTER